MGTVPSLRDEQEHLLDSSLEIRHRHCSRHYRTYPQRVEARHTMRQAHVATQLAGVQEAVGSRLLLVARCLYGHEYAYVQSCLP